MNNEEWLSNKLSEWEATLNKCPTCPKAYPLDASGAVFPLPREINALLDDLVTILLPQCSTGGVNSLDCADGSARKSVRAVAADLLRILELAARLLPGVESAQSFARDATERFFDEAPTLRDVLREDVIAGYEGDPAARSEMEVVLAYPGFYAIAVHRVAHALRSYGFPLVPRVMSEHAHSLTGIDIHPGAEIGAGFFIDHGTGVVIGETCTIGRRVKLYQGVTLGALSFAKDDDGGLVKGIKRHPDVEDNVVIYAGATILGGDTRIGHDSVIGGNVWLIHSVPPFSKVYNATPAPTVKFGAED